jgi:hypothetical protein
MARIVQTVEMLSLDATSLRLLFRWDGARWSHRIELEGDAIADSLEFQPGRDDPKQAPSPAYQQVSGQAQPGVARALLVGQWGPFHGSAVYSLFEDEGAREVVVESDIAVRGPSSLRSLASTYVVRLRSGDLASASPQGIAWNLRNGLVGQLGFEPLGASCHVSLAEAGRSATRVQVSADLTPGAATQRLLYRWRWRVGLHVDYPARSLAEPVDDDLDHASGPVPRLSTNPIPGRTDEHPE